MTDYEKINLVKVFAGDIPNLTDSVVSAYLTAAKSAILTRQYITPPTPCPTLNPKYDMLQCRLAVRYIDRMGAEGETAHNENGINRSYGSANDEDLLSEVTPVAKVIK